MKEQIAAWLAGQLDDDWFVDRPRVEIDRDEILVVGTLPEPALGDDTSPDNRRLADHSRVERWREETRSKRVAIARQAEATFDRTVSWGARCGDVEELFTTLSVPAMTRLRMPERRVLDTLIDAGVARSRSEALAWCVRLVGERQDDWLSDLREAIKKVHDVRTQGPTP